MGAVWLARDELLDREVAIKHVLSAAGVSPAEAEEQRSRALREGRIAARLTHPHVIAMYDVALDANDPWLVMEHLPSRSLAAVMTAHGPLPPRQVAQIGAQLADALTAAHLAGVVHRDVKPGNVLIAEGAQGNGVVKITDFGISRANGDVTVTRTGIITGTPAFFAPEAARGEVPTAASDVFSLGATLYAAVEGAPPFGTDENAIALLHTVAAGEVNPPLRAGVLGGALLRMLEPNPSQRPTMEQARDELAAVAAGDQGDPTEVLAATGIDLHPARPQPPTADRTLTRTDIVTGAVLAAQPARRRSLVPLVVVVILLLLAVGVVAVAVTRFSASTAASVGALSTTQSSTRAPTSTTQPSTPAATSSSAAAAASSAATTPTPPPTTANPPPPPITRTPPPATVATTTVATPARLDNQTAERAVRDYYGLLPGSTQAAFARLGPSLAAQGFDNYNAFWVNFSRIELRSARASGNGATVQIQVAFVRPDGSVTAEAHLLNLISGADGRVLINTDQVQSSRSEGG